MSSKKINEPFAVAFGQVIRKLRTEAGHSQEGFALHCGIDRGYMGHIERGNQTPSIATVWKIAGGLGVPPHQIIKQVEETLGKTDSGGGKPGTKRKPSRKLPLIET